MSGIAKTKRTALTWDQEFKPRVKDLEDYLSRTTGSNSVSNADLFMLCLAIGFDSGKMRPVPSRKSDAVRVSYLKEHHLAIMKSARERLINGLWSVFSDMVPADCTFNVIWYKETEA